MKKEVIIERAKAKHGDKYDYSFIVDTHIKGRVNIICPTHGMVSIPTDSLVNGKGCGLCGNSMLITKEEFIKRAKIRHGDKYDYSLVNYINSKTPVNIICLDHGVFSQTPDNHSSGHGCRLCSTEKNSLLMKNVSDNSFINKANIIHNFKYKYDNSIYIKAKKKIKITCDIHGDFKQTPNAHLSGNGCPKCGIQYSIGENEIKNFIENELNLKTEKIRIDNKEIDIFIPDKSIGIEYNGLYWHSSNFKKYDFHKNKTTLCENNNIHLLQIFEDEWANKKNIIKSIIKSKLGLSSERIYARKCKINEIDSQTSTIFLNDNHLQGNIGSNVKLGLYFNNELVSVMSFGKKRISMGSKTNIIGEYEMLRYCSKINTNIVGGASKLLNYFIKKYKPSSIITFADRRFSNGNLYREIGFKFNGYTQPSYSYFKKTNTLKREFRYKYRKTILIKDGYDKNKTEFQIMEERGYFRIYDCGCMKFLMLF